MTAATIRATKNPTILFDMEHLDTSYKALIKTWHPDISHDNETFLHIQKMYEVAKAYSTKSIVLTSTTLFHAATHTQYDIQDTIPFELGTIYVGPNHITYHLTSDQAHRGIPQFTYTSRIQDLQKEFERYLPSTHTDVLDEDGSKYIIIPKTEKQLLLHSVLQCNKVPLETVTWIFNRLYNLSCYMMSQNKLNYGIEPKALLVDFEQHIVRIVGGWWYTYAIGSKLSAMPITTFNVLSAGDKSNKVARVGTVLDQIKACILGIQSSNPILKNWCLTPGLEDSIQEYKIWNDQILPKIFPVRKFYVWTPKR